VQPRTFSTNYSTVVFVDNQYVIEKCYHYRVLFRIKIILPIALTFILCEEIHTTTKWIFQADSVDFTPTRWELYKHLY